MSYVPQDNLRGRLTELRELLSEEAGSQIGEDFPIFHDRNDIAWGENWDERIENSLDEVTFLIPIITPRFFNSLYCRKELQQFLEREEKLGRRDLILPIYYIDSPLLNDEAQRATDELAQAIGTRQYADWRELRVEPFTSPQVARRLVWLGTQIRKALERVREPREQVAPEPRRRPESGETLSLSQRGESATESSTATRQPVAKPEPPTRIVDQIYRGDHATITAAIEAAKPGDRILVRPGLYREGLVIDKPLEIIGEGELDEIVVQAIGKNALLFQTTIGRVANLTLRQAGGGNWFGVNIGQGRLSLEGCDISSQSWSCVAIHGGADPRLRRNRIHDSKQGGGVYIYDNGLGTLEDNEIFGNALAGVEIKEGSDPTLRRDRIHDNQGGVLIWINGQGTLEDNEIFGNASVGVEIREGGDPTLRRNRINKNGYENGYGAVYVHDAGGGTIEDNDLRDNAQGAWDVSADSEPNLKRARNKE